MIINQIINKQRLIKKLRLKKKNENIYLPRSYEQFIISNVFGAKLKNDSKNEQKTAN